MEQDPVSLEMIHWFSDLRMKFMAIMGDHLGVLFMPQFMLVHFKIVSGRIATQGNNDDLDFTSRRLQANTKSLHKSICGGNETATALKSVIEVPLPSGGSKNEFHEFAVRLPSDSILMFSYTQPRKKESNRKTSDANPSQGICVGATGDGKPNLTPAVEIHRATNFHTLWVFKPNK